MNESSTTLSMRIPESEVCTRYHVTPQVLIDWRAKGLKCVPAGLGRERMYKVADLDKFHAENPECRGNPGGDHLQGVKHDFSPHRGRPPEDRSQWKCRCGLPMSDPVHMGITTEAVTGKQKLDNAKLRKEQAIAAKREIELEVLRGSLISREEVDQERLARIHVVKALLLALPGKLAPRLAHQDTLRIHEELEKAVREMLEEFSRG